MNKKYNKNCRLPSKKRVLEEKDGIYEGNPCLGGWVNIYKDLKPQRFSTICYPYLSKLSLPYILNSPY